jgi:hypothetical protein
MFCNFYQKLSHFNRVLSHLSFSQTETSCHGPCRGYVENNIQRSCVQTSVAIFYSPLATCNATSSGHNTRILEEGYWQGSSRLSDPQSSHLPTVPYRMAPFVEGVLDWRTFESSQGQETHGRQVNCTSF